MEIGVFPPYGDDHERNIAFCRDAGANCIALRVGEDPKPDELLELKAKYAQAGIDFSVVLAPRITTEALIDERLRAREIDTLRRIIRSMGEAGVRILHLYVSSVRAPSVAKEREVFMGRLIEYYRQIVEQAERSRVRIATHTFHSPSRLIWNHETFNRLLEAVPSPCNGVLFCTGKTQYAGDDMVETIRRYGSKIVLVHIRDVAGDYVPGAYDLEEDRALEARFDMGDVDVPLAFRTLKEIGFSGPVFAEHYPAIAGNRTAALAWTVGYFKAIEACLGG